MDLNRYQFATTWDLDAPMSAVVDALADLAAYPRWWPEVRTVRQLDETSAHLVIRSFLPYSLGFTAIQSRRDVVAGVLEASMSGDLDGFSRWTITQLDDGRTRAVFEEGVLARKRLLRALGPVARPLFRL
ncbi:MAG: SRPBCC family protein, partial [Actinocrinis sp.]